MGATFGGAGASALSDLIAIAFPVTAGDGSVPNQKNNDQPTVTEILKEEVRASAGWNSASGSLFAGLPVGIPFVLGMPVTIISQLTGLPIDDLLEPWLDNPVVENLSDSVGSAMGFVGEFMGGLLQFLGDINPLDPDFNIADAAESFVNLILLPTNLLPALVGGFLPSGIIPGLDASQIISGTLGAGVVQPLIDAVSQGFGGTTGLNFTSLQSFLGGLSFGGISFDDLIALIPGTTGGLSGDTGLEAIFDDLFGILGSPTGVGDGTPTLPGITGIPLLGGLLSGSTFLGSLIPNLDASKITSGTFAQTMVANLSTMLGGFSTGSSIISQLLGLIPNLAGSTTGLTGLGDVFTDLFSLLGNPTNVGSTGTLTLPGITSIPLLGGLLSGSTFLGSLIPSLDASKIGSGTFADSLLPGLGSLRDAIAQAINGGSTTGYTAAQVKTALSAIPGGNIASAVLASIIPSLDASKITTGTLGTGLIPNVTKAMSTDLQATIDSVYQAINGGTSTGNTTASVKTALLSIPGANIVSAVLASIIPSLDASKITTGSLAQARVTGLTTLASDVVNIPKNMFDTWFGGSSGTGATTEVTTTVAAIKASVIGGYTLQTFTSSNASYSVPSGLANAGEAYAGVIGGGGKGTAGTVGGPPGGSGGGDGGYLCKQIDPSTLASTLAITIGAAASTAGASGGTSKIMSGATTLVQSVPNQSGMSTVTGYATSSSEPGQGGTGGVVAGGGNIGSPGSDGTGSADATGGSGGAGYSSSSGSGSGGTGGAGSAGTTSAVPITGGGGGGGGGGADTASFGTATGGTGGAGGFPGGGSGGGGCADGFSRTVGQPGTPANGFAFLIWK